MGNGPGGLKEYWDIMESSKRFTGGFLWEWADHGIRYDMDGLRYGGDFGEYLHDGNFCIDGIVSADRKIKAGTLQMKYYYQPLKFDRIGNTLIISNKNFFKAETGELAINGVIQSVCIPPRESIVIAVPDDDIKAQYFVDGKEYARAQFLTEKSETAIIPVKITTEVRGHSLAVKAGNNEYLIDLQSGEIESVTANDRIFGKSAHLIR